MSFTESSQNIQLDGPRLFAECRTADESEWPASELNLDEYLGNIDGTFVWGEANFSQSAQNIELHENNILTAQLCREDGEWVLAVINLDEHIANIDGQLTYQE